MPLPLRHRRTIQDYLQTADKLHPRRIERDSVIVKYTQGVIVVALGLIALWLMFQVTTPEGNATFLRAVDGVVAYVKGLI